MVPRGWFMVCFLAHVALLCVVAALLVFSYGMWTMALTLPMSGFIGATGALISLDSVE